MGDKVSWWKNGWGGLHITINPQSPLPPSAKIYRRFVERGIPLSDEQFGSLLKGRQEGISSINSALGHVAPSLGVDLRLKLSTMLADAIMDKSLSGQLSREAPTALERVDQRDQVLKHLFSQSGPAGSSRGSVPSLIKKIPPVGVSVTIHF